jgi:hypothetical protein
MEEAHPGLSVISVVRKYQPEAHSRPRSALSYWDDVTILGSRVMLTLRTTVSGAQR